MQEMFIFITFVDMIVTSMAQYFLGLKKLNICIFELISYDRDIILGKI